MNNVSVIAFYTIFRREVVRFIRIWMQTILPNVITMSLYFIIFGNLIGPRIGEMQGIPYNQYIAPGLVMLAVITSAYANVSGSFFSSRFQRNIEEMLISPTSHSVLILGFVLGGVARGLVVGLCVSIVAAFFTGFHVHHLLATIGIVFLSAGLFALMGMTNALFANKFDDISVIPVFVLTAFTYLGGVFYSIDLLAPFWQKVSLINPILYIVNAFRYGMIGITDVKLSHAVLMIFVFIVIFFAFNLWLMERGTGIRK